MEPIEFEGHNVVYAKDQPEYKPLPAYKFNTPEGEVVTCWKLSFRERIRILFTGKLWVCLMTFNKPLTPSLFTTKKSDVITFPKNESSFRNFIRAQGGRN